MRSVRAMLAVASPIHRMEFPLALGATVLQRLSSDQDVAAEPFEAAVYFAGTCLKPVWEP
jgi:hypothetical protein